MQFFRVNAAGFQPVENFAQGFHHQVRRVPLLAPNTVILFGQVGQVEKLVESPGNRQQFVIAELAQQGFKPLAGTALLAAIGFRRRPDFLDQVEALLPRMLQNALAEQFTQ